MTDKPEQDQSTETPTEPYPLLTPSQRNSAAWLVREHSGDQPDFRQKWVLLKNDADATPENALFHSEEDARRHRDAKQLTGYNIHGPFRMAASSMHGWNSTSGDPHPMALMFERSNGVDELVMVMRDGTAIRRPDGYYSIVIV